MPSTDRASDSLVSEETYSAVALLRLYVQSVITYGRSHIGESRRSWNPHSTDKFVIKNGTGVHSKTDVSWINSWVGLDRVFLAGRVCFDFYPEVDVFSGDCLFGSVFVCLFVCLPSRYLPND